MKFLIQTCTETNVLCDELKVKHYKELLKSLYGDEPNPVVFFETLWDILSDLTNKDKSFFKQVSLIDLFLYIIQIRINSQGDACNLVLMREGKKNSIELRLDFLVEELLLAYAQHETLIACNENTEVLFECPSSQKLLQYAPQEFLRFLKGVFVIKNQKKTFVEIKTIDEATQIFNKVPLTTSLAFVKAYESFINTASNINFLTRYNVEDQHICLLPSTESFIWLIKLLFNESLDGFYNNMFYLSYLGHMNSRYLENCTPGEYMLYAQLLESNLAAAQKNSNGLNSEEFPQNEEFDS